MSSPADDTRMRILEIAGEIFADKGFSATTVRDICSAANVNVAAVNYHFRDKMGLYVEAVKHAHACRFNEPPPTWHEGTPVEQKLYDFVHGMLRHLLDPNRPAWNARLMMRELADPTEACQAITNQYIRPMALVLHSIVSELVPPDTSLMRVQMTAFSVVGQCLFYRVQEPVAKELVGAEQYALMTVDLIAEHIASFTLAAFGRRLPAEIASSESQS
ncbi:MAG TPA: CerR family C-terminal domain-containing protein [Pirellulaceae bacterium]|nr:CerR family C-terminal domain-containing protein [Pirellulaceae bacterium]